MRFLVKYLTVHFWILEKMNHDFNCGKSLKFQRSMYFSTSRLLQNVQLIFLSITSHLILVIVILFDHAFEKLSIYVLKFLENNKFEAEVYSICFYTSKIKHHKSMLYYCMHISGMLRVSPPKLLVIRWW